MNSQHVKLYVKKTFSIINDDILLRNLFLLKSKFLKIKKTKKKIIIIGNGGSASTASHLSVDLTKNAKIRSTNFNESNLLTCFANDYGFDKVFTKALDYYSESGDLVLILSVSGNSNNLVEAIKFCKKKKLDVVTFTGFKNNKIYKLNKKKLNFPIKSNSYNQVEIIHHFLLLTLVDILIGKFEYGTNL